MNFKTYKHIFAKWKFLLFIFVVLFTDKTEKALNRCIMDSLSLYIKYLNST